jgi:hypothetical protein
VINAPWHKSHPMPESATPQQRLRWHLAHAKACSCRTLTASMLRELRRLAQKPALKGRPASPHSRRAS